MKRNVNIYIKKRDPPKGKDNIYNILNYFYDVIKDADFVLTSLNLKNIKENDMLNFFNYIFNFYLKEIYKNFFFYLTRMNLINKYLHDYYNFFHVIIDNSKIFNIDISNSIKTFKQELQKRGNQFLIPQYIKGVYEEKEYSIQENTYKYKDMDPIDDKQNQPFDITQQKYINKETEITNEMFLSRKYKSLLLLQNKRNISEHEQIYTSADALETYSDSNVYIKSKRKKKIQNVNKELFYIHNGIKRYIFNYPTVNSNYYKYENNDDHNIINHIIMDKNIKQNQQMKNIKENEKEKEKYNYSNFYLFNNTLKSFGKDIISSINYFIYNNDDHMIKNYEKDTLYFDLDKKHIIKYFTSTMKKIKCIKMKECLHSYEKKDQFITYFPIYKKNTIFFNPSSIKNWIIFQNLPLYNYIILNYLYDKKEDMLILFCEDTIIHIKSKKKHCVIRKENIIKIEMCCIYFNITFECDKNIIFNIKNIIKKNKNNFLGLYFDILFKNKNKKRLIKKIQKNLVKILYFLYYVFHFIYNYNKKIENMNKLKNTNLYHNINHQHTNKKKNTTSYKSKEHPFITIFVQNQKTIFSFSSITYFYHFFINIRDQLFNTPN
ncbi:hypothetical protein PFMC_04459 [Plasmodium falciparum CAMP/Malaysia]|nr:hypothetical protein PFMC_04459 [Plasmodium falciparum CAMP/Malaysia]